jgi:hypothetical protein
MPDELGLKTVADASSCVQYHFIISAKKSARARKNLALAQTLF